MPFQSTRPVRGGTAVNWREYAQIIFQSTRPVRGGTAPTRCAAPRRPISIHPPRAGRDVFQLDLRVAGKEFQSTRPVRGGTLLRCEI